MTESNQQVLEQQIAELQKQLDSTREQNGVDGATQYERQEVHAAVGEQIKQQVPSYAPVPAQTNPVSDVPGYQNPQLVAQVQQLVNVAFTQSIQEAINQAVKTNNPALIDALHDVLADQLHDELIKRQKLQPAV